MDENDGGLRLSGVSKSFGATQALVDGVLTLRPGEVHTLLGENGSGKSTLVKIIGGVHRPGGGQLTLDGKPLVLRSPRQASARGIATVFQEVLTAGSQSVLENVWLGSHGIFTRALSRADQRTIAAEVLERLLGDVPLDAPASQLSLSERQALCIARALVRRPRVLVLDESTASLDVRTRDKLFGEMRRLKDDGCAILFISHRMDEVAEISDRVTVLRSGRTISTVERSGMSIPRLIDDMTGTSVSDSRQLPERTIGDVALRTTQVRLSPESEPIDLVLRAGELVGIAGLEGHGQDAFLKRLGGIDGGAGQVLRVLPTGDAPVLAKNAPSLGVAYLPRERRGESLFESMSIAENFALPTMRQDRVGPFLSLSRMAERFDAYRAALGIRLGSPADAISTLSGGSQQKILLARWLATKPDILLLNDPTRGVDVTTKHEIYNALGRLCVDGMSVIVLSSDVDELVEMVDRVLVFRDNTVVAELLRPDINAQSIIAAYFGQATGASA